MLPTLNDSAYGFYNREPSPRFLDGKTFRAFKLLKIPGNTTYVVKLVLPVPVYFTKFDVALDASTVEIETVSGGTEGGLSQEGWSRIKMNRARPTSYLAKTEITAGGTHTGGTTIDVVRIKTDGNATRGASVIQNDGSIRGIAAGTYYWRFVNKTADEALGTVKIEWEELDA